MKEFQILLSCRARESYWRPPTCNRKSVEMIVLGKRESVVTRLQEERDGFGEKVVGAEVVGEEVGERAEVRVFM